jgi:hypothetical protein
MKKSRATPKATQARPDPLIDEVRAIRAKISKRFGDDLEGYFAHVRQVGERWRTQLEKGRKTGKQKIGTKRKRKS